MLLVSLLDPVDAVVVELLYCPLIALAVLVVSVADELVNVVATSTKD